MRFIIGFFAALFLVSSIWVLLIFMQLNRPVLSSQWVYDAYKKKEELLANAKSPRLVIVAGSNALFGIDSSVLEKKYNMDVVNMGVNAGLLLPYILYRAQKELKIGDIVLLPLEYPMYNYDGEPNEQMISFLYSFDPDFFWFLTLKERFLVLWKTPFSRIVEGFLKTGGKPIDYGLYGAHRINNNGDQTGTEKSKIGPAEKSALDALKPNRYGYDYKKNPLAWYYLENFNSWAKKHNICLIFIPSVLMDDPFYHNDKLEREFYDSLPKNARSHGLNYIGKPFDFMYPKSWFFNTDYHLNSEARERHTHKLIELLGDNLLNLCPN